MLKFHFFPRFAFKAIRKEEKVNIVAVSQFICENVKRNREAHEQNTQFGAVKKFEISSPETAEKVWTTVASTNENINSMRIWIGIGI